MAAYPLLFIFPFVMLYAAVNDILSMRIANVVSVGLAAAFVVVALVAGMPPEQILVHVGVGLAVLLANMLLFHMRLVGGGDAKLLAAAAMWVGYDQLVPFIVYVTIFGGVLALVLLAYRRLPVDALPLPDWASRLHQPGEGMPYGVAIAAGALIVYPLTSVPGLLGA